MDVKTTFLNLKREYPGLVLGLGNFDGVHLGHRELIQRLVARAREIGGVPAVLTFHPHPLAVLCPGSAPPLLLTQEAKEEIIAGLGVQLLLRIPFEPGFARLSPEEFISRVLHGELGVISIFVGYNYTFGHRGRGVPATLEHFSRRYGYEVTVIEPVKVDGEVVSSTLIRDLLTRGRVEEARRFLGYTPFLDGVVVAGDGRGRVLGFPTANLRISPDVLVPANGVYAVRVELGGRTFAGVANIGQRPTFESGSEERRVEIHLFNMSGDLYGQSLRVFLSGYIREERKFGSPGELVRQIRSDIRQAQGYE